MPVTGNGAGEGELEAGAGVGDYAEIFTAGPCTFVGFFISFNCLGVVSGRCR